MNFIDLFTSLDGRINRKRYWLSILALLVVSLAVQVIGYLAGGMNGAMISGLVFVWPSFALAVKRAHDRNKTGWMPAIFFALVLAVNYMQLAGLHEDAFGKPSLVFGTVSVVFLGFAIYGFVVWGCLRGTTGPNRYGPDPLQPSS
ncbi:MAG: DUF805 domain-containing protein [Xanthobacteraceae bacterium]|nr:DUF805 domain-containing protein [Xanthobacteraceae bacterium]MBX3523812.1 DUF805 domain-containing protein [Xanthobacteraceae bacterium]MBX3533806.1 DUF805 domain-containing protein [Xanthobacteraceae bacterium]MCW5673587.1 DUF805 domain-containing protein [Xanthobacteraceae bacterium]MCW5678911.1 DUF805 domain-containing protein [Xanthobacteraceae bacterium]